ncbi:hypothetical protein ALI144C_00905 [Actinosynnema sp. ALI-1.44]|uniref:hypothetical protein n=1 Tax=Actinosynnema sp. ALI-1.44 TaxID=1933779 RepID=UPI00097BFE34|nr:hypothetical protein [Actinosynnema sp. ALI-1.44]ONI91656.1 hypothetical protein ALI144C_00905 [Actinosynnema sp. ALI-1.44]
MIEHADNANIAGDGATVGNQAEWVHNSTVYFVSPDASPQRKYEVDSLKDGDREHRAALTRLHDLPATQRDKIVRHLDLVLTGMKDTVWADSRQDAEDTRLSNGRRDRVWAYFHPDPVGPRVRAPAAKSTVPGDRLRAQVWSTAQSPPVSPV